MSSNTYSTMVASAFLVSFSATSEAAPVTTYDCGEVARHQGRANSTTLFVQPDGVNWLEEIQGVEIQGGLHFIYDEERLKFEKDGFKDQRFGHPMISFDFPRGLAQLGHRNRYLNGELDAHVASEVRVGSKAKRKWVPSNLMASLMWNELEDLLTEPGDINITLYDKEGPVHYRMTIPRPHFHEIESALKLIHRRVMAKLKDKEHLCKGETHDDDDDAILISRNGSQAAAIG